MHTNRREFIKSGLAAAGSLSLVPLATATSRPETESSTLAPLKILVLGGTGFIGPNVVRYAISRGHTISTFTRGRTNADMFKNEPVEMLIGDRDGKLDVLHNREWDVCIDNTGYVPRIVRDSAELLKDSVGRYLFTSTRQVFADFREPDKKEDAAKATMDDPTSENVNQNYGALKVLCENVVNEVFGKRATVVRPTAVAGPRDRSDRFTYWPVRINRGGEVLAPGYVTDPIQYIDVRDLAEFMVHLVENDTSGAFNAAGLNTDLSVAEFLYGCRAITGAPVKFIWVPADFLEKHNIRARREVPLWIAPKISGETRSPVNRDKAIKHGLTFRPLAVTARDTLDWFLSKPKSEQTMRVGLSAEQEAKVLQAFRA